MNFSEKIKKIRKDNNLTQDELAEKLYVTRTAISKWETGKGYPSIESFKMISDLFGISIDDLISDEDVESQRILEKKKSQRFYYIAVGFLAFTLIAAVLSTVTQISYLYLISLVGIVGYVACAFLSKLKYKRIEAKKYVVTFIISRVVILLVVIAIAISIIMNL